MSGLPPGWTRAALSEIGSWVGGGTPSKSIKAFWDGDIPWVSPKDMKSERIRDAIDHISMDAVEQSATNVVPQGSVLLVTRSGILRHTLPVAVVDREVALNQDLKALIPAAGISPDYLTWTIGARAQDILHTCSKSGTTVNNLETRRLLAFKIPIAPAKEQLRIVAAIEERFSRLDAATGSLSVVERRLDALQAAALASISHEEWPVVRLAEVTESQIYGTSQKASDDAEGVAVLRMGNIQAGRIDFSKLKYLPAGHPDVAKLALQPGDILFNRTNSPELVGKAAVFTGRPEPVIFASYLIRVRLTSECLPEWAAILVNGPIGRRYIAEVRTQQVGQANVNGTKLSAMPIPLPPLHEQRRIVADVEERLSMIGAMRATIEVAQRRSEALRRSILARAFQGQLVPQDPSDEPATVLLERIRAERTERNGPAVQSARKKRDAALPGRGD